MSEFTASNGATLKPIVAGGRRITYSNGITYPIPSYGLDALREFFRHEEDQRLGRWRWPENPDYVVYPASVLSRVRVMRETGMGDLEWVDKGDARSYEFCLAARAYFDAHPEPKPWHDAKPGEVWMLTVDGVEECLRVLDASPVARFFPIGDDQGMTYGRRAPGITAGRRLWPEVAS